MHAGTVTFTLNMPVVFREEFGWIVGEFPTLGVASQGRTREEAERNLIEAAQLFIESCYERNRQSSRRLATELARRCGCSFPA